MSRKEIDTKIKEDFGEIMHKTRLKKRISQENLSEFAGITDAHLRNLESGSCIATWLIWLRICTILNIDIPELQKKYIIPELAVIEKNKDPLHHIAR